MSSQFPTSSLPPTFQEDGEPAQFLDWMQSQMSDLLEDPHLVIKPKRPEWVKTVSNLLTVLSLPSPTELPWTAMHEQNKFVEVSLTLIYHAVQRVPSLFAGETVLAQALSSTIIALCATLDLWIDVNVPPEEGYLSPSQLYAKATETAAAHVQALLDEVLPQARPRSYGVVRDILSRYMALVNGALYMPLMYSPMRVLMFSEELVCSSEDTEYPMTIDICPVEEVVKSFASVSKVCESARISKLTLTLPCTEL